MNLSGNVLLAAKAAAYQRADDAHRLVVQPQALRHLPPVAIRDLTAHIDRQLVKLLVGPPVVSCRDGHRALRLQEGVLGHGRAVGAFDDEIGCGEPLLHVTVPHFDVLDQVPVGAVRVELGRVRLQRIARIGDRHQHFVLHVDQRHCLLGDLCRIRHHQRNRIAHIAGRIGAPGEDRPVVFDQSVARVARHIRVRQHRADARQRARPVCVDFTYACMGMFAAQGCAEQHPVESIVVGIARRPRHLVDRVRPLMRLADLRQRLHHLRQLRLRHRSCAHELARRFHRVDDRRIAGAATVGILQALLDLGIARLRVLVQQRLRLHDEAGRAEAALRRPVQNEC